MEGRTPHCLGTGWAPPRCSSAVFQKAALSAHRDKQIPASNTKQLFSLRSLQRSTEKCECSKFLSSSKSKKSPKPAFFFKKKYIMASPKPPPTQNIR